MQRANFKVELSEELVKEKQMLVEKLLNDDLVKKLFNDNKMDYALIEEHAYVLNDYVACLNKCEGCKGLAFCVQEKEGCIVNLIFDDVDVHKEITKCAFALEKENNLKHSHNMLINDMSEFQLTNLFATTDPIDESINYNVLFKDLLMATKQPSRQGFYLCGEPGVGKTYLACCFVNEMSKQGRRCSFVHVPTMVANLKTMMFDHNAFRREVYAMKHCDVLILDDIGGESASGWSRDDILLPLLNERMEKGLQTLFTSNYSLEKLEKFYTLKSKAVNDIVGAKRLIERVKSLASEKVLTGSNRRVEKSRN